MIRRIGEYLVTHRAFLSHWGMELVVVMVGVLLALSVQQWSEDRGERRRGAEVTQLIEREIRTNMRMLVARIAVQPCISQQIKAISDGIGSRDPAWRPAVRPAESGRVFRRVVSMPILMPANNAFRIATTAGGMGSMAPDRFADLSSVYAYLAAMERFSYQEIDLARRLTPLQFGPPRTEEGRGAVLDTLVTLDALNTNIVVGAKLALARIDELGLGWAGKAPGAEPQWYRSRLVELRNFNGDCVDPRAFDVFRPRPVVNTRP